GATCLPRAQPPGSGERTAGPFRGPAARDITSRSRHLTGSGGAGRSWPAASRWISRRGVTELARIATRAGAAYEIFENTVNPSAVAVFTVTTTLWIPAAEEVLNSTRRLAAITPVT